MEKLEAKTDGKSMDVVSDNIMQLKNIFPEIFTEGKIDFELLKELLGEYSDDREECYSFNWNGKSRARMIAQTPSTGTLRPFPEESIDWNSTHNLFIEGDNLEVLKLLQKSYHKKIKMIYIDPPYNRGREFIYPDKYQDNLSTYLRYTGQIDAEGLKLSTNSETSGRYHTNWLNMMYPRLRLARNLLRDDGVIFISIDDKEIANLRKITDEIFGEENFVAEIVWKKRSTPPNDKIIGAQHEYLVVYCKHIGMVDINMRIQGQHEYLLVYCKDIDLMNINLRRRTEDQLSNYKNPDNHPKGPWTSGDLMANVKGGRYVESLYFPIVNPRTGQEHYPSSNGNWRFNKEKIEDLINKNEIYFGEDDKGRPKLKRFLCDVKDGITWTSLWDFVPLNTSGSEEMASIFGNLTTFENPKPMGLILETIKAGLNRDDLILDFFAGSCTTAHAVLEMNKEDGGNRKFIMVQLPEPCDKSSEAFKAGYRTIAEIGKERIRRIIKKNKDESPGYEGDLGFKVFKLDSTNIKPWDVDEDDLQKVLEDYINNIKDGRSEHDVLYEIILKSGLDLTLPVEEREIAAKKVFIIGTGALIICLANDITLDVVEGIVELKEELQLEGNVRIVFKDLGFKDDVVKTNALQILKFAGIDDVKSL